MKKIFVDIYLKFNLGDDLFLDILAKKYPAAQFTVNHLGNNYDDFISQYTNVKRRKYSLVNKIGQRLKLSDSITNFHAVAEEHDALLFIGGSIFREEDYHSNLYADRLKLVKEFKKRNKPVFILGANFGPYQTKGFLSDYKELFEMCADVCFRDTASYELFKDLPQIRHAPDIVFQMDIKEYKEITIKDRVGFSIIDVKHKQGLSEYYNDYLRSTVNAIELLTSKGYECCLMSFCEDEGDLQVTDSIISTLSPEALKNTIKYSYKGNLKEAINIIASFKLFVAARFHANILAIIFESGVMPIIYSHKTTHMLEDIQLADILVTMENLHIQFNEKIILKALNNKADITNVAFEAAAQFEKLSEFLKFEISNRGAI
ncbi:polysaccharide pyruvyl transferase family protein [Metabacillus sp. 84]|uniref:polysaccharide pyruvyl transferase family protein n=1 Tax=unclassified Metabacillus TaxID=2675274 RepID=UPI003CEFA860